VIEHFRVLPTDERYEALSDDQVSFLFSYWILSPGEKDIKADYWRIKREELAQSAPPDEALMAIGYSAKQIADIKKELVDGHH
jgi:hypothetical protein